MRWILRLFIEFCIKNGCCQQISAVSAQKRLKQPIEHELRNFNVSHPDSGQGFV